MNKTNLKKTTFIVPIRNEKINVTLFYQTINAIYFNFDVLFVYDLTNENSINELKQINKTNPRVKFIFSKIPGVKRSITLALSHVKSECAGVLLADDLGILYRLDEVVDLLKKNPEAIISATRYTKGGKRMYGSFVEILFSKTANSIFKILYNLDDATTAFRFGKTKKLLKIYNQTKNNDWSINLEISFIAKKNLIPIIFVPIISIDRLRFGESTFKLKTWFYEYILIFLKKIKGGYH
jgi:hypothetical protein